MWKSCFQFCWWELICNENQKLYSWRLKKKTTKKNHSHLLVFACCNCASGLPGRDGQPGCVRTPAANPAQQEGHSLRKHARDLQLPQQASSGDFLVFGVAAARVNVLWLKSISLISTTRLQTIKNIKPKKPQTLYWVLHLAILNYKHYLFMSETFRMMSDSNGFG